MARRFRIWTKRKNVKDDMWFLINRNISKVMVNVQNFTRLTASCLFVLYHPVLSHNSVYHDRRAIHFFRRLQGGVIDRCCTIGAVSYKETFNWISLTNQCCSTIDWMSYLKVVVMDFFQLIPITNNYQPFMANGDKMTDDFTFMYLTSSWPF